MTRKNDFVALGFCSNDYLAVLPHIPMDSKVQMLEHLVQGGGPAATAAVAASRLGWSAAFVGTVGDDAPGRTILADFAAENVDSSAVLLRPGKRSPIAYCWVDAPTGKRSVAWTRGDLPELEPAEIPAEMIAQARVLHLDGHQTAAALAAAKLAKEHGVMVNIDAGTLLPGLEELLEYVDILITSAEIARQLTGEDDPDRALRKLGSIGAEVTGLTMGDTGSLVLAPDGGILRCPAFKLDKVVDTTGAGDVYHAGFAVRYAETRDRMESMRFASAVAAMKCTKLGGRTGIPTRAEVKKFLQTH